ncbi:MULTISPECIES: RNA polymerase sigma factor [Parabacteroides]|jgi:RNA polymerase sigma-70 factor (family 1)|uniref:RNA polymerase sigma-70 factor n=1 Tax=Parabacteroides gordonii MS-1 = DSM 23371 TaxID=1203610 RepID=A0A0F5JPF5_9BACT|nr:MULTISPECIES: RNA polymerase sigma-70 factor [Parabacteroides]KKB48227.1 RNA polymerase sigma-70 factor [Parabacteroides sp. HGS0025]KKB59696.1 RNA polymerase sigma-70 factor [Parabacteroides gordonii MS-1 = DSM 23371]MCA5583901.1 RNA polymerase sigma-70 factor [Parabacteroides gordonii]RGP09511.1 RNA polymerase sigma-70 factor [Parabacteroides gordonii]
MPEKSIHCETIKKLQEGSYEAFDTLYNVYADSLYGFALLHTKSTVQAEDIVQDTFLKLWNMRESLSVEGSFKSMLFTIAKNHVIDIFRQQVNRANFEDYIAFCEDENLLDNTSVEKVYYNDFLEKLAIAKQKLTPAQRNIFELSREEGMSNTEIAAASNLSEQTVKNHLSAALKVLRVELGKYNFLFALFI